MARQNFWDEFVYYTSLKTTAPTALVTGSSSFQTDRSGELKMA